MVAFTSLLLAFAVYRSAGLDWVVADLNIGILFFLMLAGLAVYAVLFAGWSVTTNTHCSAQCVPRRRRSVMKCSLGLSVLGVVAQAGSFNLLDIVNSQTTVWNVIPQIFGFITLRLRAWRCVSPSPV